MQLGTILKPEILFSNILQNKVEIGLKVPIDLAYCEGHFPDFPIVPGIVQIHWVVDFIRAYFMQAPILSKCSVIKFSHLIRPMDVITLTLEHFPEKSIVTYTYSNESKTLSSGRLNLGEPHVL